VLEGPGGAARLPLLADPGVAAAVLWLRAADLGKGLAGALPTYVSGTMLDGAAPQGANLRMVYPWQLPNQAAQHGQRAAGWLRARGLGAHGGRTAVDTYFAAALVGEALSQLMDSFSRDYFVETVEHEMSTTVLASSYPAVSLGPDQRFASKGVYIASAAGLAEETPPPPLIVP
jgi:hypothetical protein